MRTADERNEEDLSPNTNHTAAEKRAHFGPAKPQKSSIQLVQESTCARWCSVSLRLPLSFHPLCPSSDPTQPNHTSKYPRAAAR
jgi:hypothetical protein